MSDLKLLTPTNVPFYSLVCRMLLASAGIELNPGPPSKFTGLNTQKIVEAIFEVTGGTLPTDHQFSQLRGPTSFWSLVAEKALGKEIKWGEKVKKASRFIYKQVLSKRAEFGQALQRRLQEKSSDGTNPAQTESDQSAARNGQPEDGLDPKSFGSPKNADFEDNRPALEEERECKELPRDKKADISSIPEARVPLKSTSSADGAGLAMGLESPGKCAPSQSRPQSDPRFPSHEGLSVTTAKEPSFNDSDVDEEAFCRILDDIQVQKLQTPTKETAPSLVTNKRPAAGKVGSTVPVQFGSLLLQVMIIPGDGSCIYHALAHQIFGVDFPNDGEISLAIRRNTADYLKKNVTSEHVRLSILTQVEDTINANQQCRYASIRRKGEDTLIEAYLEDFLSGVVTCADVEIQAAREIFGARYTKHTQTTQNIRSMIANHLRKKARVYRKSLLAQVDDQITSNASCRYGHLKRKAEDALIQAYLEDTASGVAWGGDDAIAAATALYNVAVEVYSKAAGSFYSLRPDGNEPRHTVRLLYDGTHYSSIVSVEPENKESGVKDEKDEKPMHPKHNLTAVVPATAVKEVYATPTKAASPELCENEDAVMSRACAESDACPATSNAVDSPSISALSESPEPSVTSWARASSHAPSITGKTCLEVTSALADLHSSKNNTSSDLRGPRLKTADVPTTAVRRLYLTPTKAATPKLCGTEDAVMSPACTESDAGPATSNAVVCTLTSTLPEPKSAILTANPVAPQVDSSLEKKKCRRKLTGLTLAAETDRIKSLGIKLHFSLQLSQEEWNKLYSPARKRLENWTDLFADKFAKYGNPFCVLIFNTSRTASPSKTVSAPRFRAIAHCKFDGCFSFTFTVPRPEGKTKKTPLDCASTCHVVEVRTFGKFRHPEGRAGEDFEKLRRQFKGERREELRRLTKNKLPNELKLDMLEQQRSENQDVLLAGNYSNVPSQTQLQKISSEQNLEEDLSNDILRDVELTAALYKEKYKADVIHRFGQRPFQVLWHTPIQTNYYAQLKTPFQVHIDATGSEICRLPMAESDIHHYALSVPGKPGKPPLTITEFLTEWKDFTNIWLWLKTWADTVAKSEGHFSKPSVAVMDYSWPCIHSTLSVFCGRDIIQYLHSVLKDTIDHTVIQLCCSHIIHTAARYLHSKTKKNEEGSEARRLALFLFAAMQRTSDIDEAKELVRHSYVIFNSENLTAVVKCSLAFVQDLLANSEKGLPQDNENDYMDVDGQDEESLCSEIREGDEGCNRKEKDVLYKQSPFYHIFQEVMTRDDIAGTSEVRNPYYIRGYMKYLSVYILPYYPLWSCYCLRKIGYTIGAEGNPPSKWPAEMVFHVSKNYILEKELHRTPGRFLRALIPAVDKRFTDALFNPDFTKKKAQQVSLDNPNTCQDKWKDKSRKGAYSKTRAAKKYTAVIQKRLAEVAAKKIKAKYLSPKKMPLLDPIPEEPEHRTSPGVLNEADITTPCRSTSSPVEITPSKDAVEEVRTRKLPIKKRSLFRRHCDQSEEVESNLLPKSTEDQQLSMESTACLTSSSIKSTNPWDITKTWVIDPMETYGEETTRAGGDRIIYKHSLTSLRLRQPLNDEVIRQFLSTRCRLAEEMLTLSVYSFDTYFLDQLRNRGGSTSMIKDSLRHNLLSQDVLLVPVNVRREHWILVVIVRKHKLILYLDSVTSQKLYDEEVVPLLKGFLLGEYRRTFGTVPDWKEWSFHKPQDIPDQGEDTNDCGVHTCLWGHVICTGSVVQPSPEDSERMRMWIMSEIMEKPILPENENQSQRKVVTTPSISRSRGAITWKKEAPLGYANTMQYCSSLYTSLYGVDHNKGSCSAKICVAKGATLFYCDLHEDWFHLDCVNDNMDSAKLRSQYRCPSCRSTPRGKKRKARETNSQVGKQRK